MDFLPEDIERYVEAHTQEEPKLLQELTRETWQKVVMPRMLSGHVQGRFLSMITKLMRPERILEIGTYTGYSTLCFAEGLAENGQIDTLELNEELHIIQDKYWKAAGVDRNIRRFYGDAKENLKKLEGPYDLAFIDADKENYDHYYEVVVPLMRPGGLILLDNVLWSGKVTEAPTKHDPETEVLRALNDRIQQDERVENVLLPLRDGIMAARVKD
jgi:predicted O-methyltransferase YrrM